MPTHRRDLASLLSDQATGLRALPKLPPWMGDALCAQTDPEIFFPDKGGTTAPAKAVCARCAVAAECLDYALEHEEHFGIWGGVSERNRRSLAHQLHPNRGDTPRRTA